MVFAILYCDAGCKTNSNNRKRRVGQRNDSANEVRVVIDLNEQLSVLNNITRIQAAYPARFYQAVNSG